MTTQQATTAANIVLVRSSLEFYRIVNGLVAEEWICSDMATLNLQLTADGA